MWIKKRSWLLLVRVKLDRQIPVIVPLSLFVLHDTVKEVGEWLELWKVLVGRLNGYKLACAVISWLNELLDTIRKLGRFRMVEVETSEIKVFIDLW